MFRVEIETDNAAFEPEKSDEVARILARLADQVSGKAEFALRYPDWVLLDRNGNKVGAAGFVADVPHARHRERDIFDTIG